MAIFSTSGTQYFGATPQQDLAPALNSYDFFRHTLQYAFDGVVGDVTHTSTYSPTQISGVEVGARFLSTDYTWLDGSGLAVQTGPFAITAGAVTGFHTGGFSGYLQAFHNQQSWDASSFSIAAATFWNLASSSQWHALWLLATAGDDILTGNNVAETQDFIEGGSGDDHITAQAGDDYLWGNDGSDFLYGGEGNDVLVCNDWAAGGASALWSEGYAEAGDDYIFTGGYGSGFLIGGAGSDRMWGGPQQDILFGDTGIDYMSGGLGLDVFGVSATGNVAGEYDFILDFVDGVDFIKLPAGAAWNIADSVYGAIISNPVTGFYLIVQYATAAAVSDQIYYA